jgi:uncharacterized protein (TIGR02117 family)
MFSKICHWLTNALLFGCLVQLTAFSLFKEWRHLPATHNDEQTVHVTSHGWHTGIVIDGDKLGSEIAFLEEYFGKNSYYELGWGDSGFYTANEITSGLTLRAMLWPTSSVMHVVALPVPPKRYFKNSDVISVKISKQSYKLLLQEMAQSFATDAQGNVNFVKKGLYGDSRFFKGNGRYYLTKTCNTWTATILDSAGVPVTSFLTLTADSVLRQIRNAKKSYVCC